MKKCITHVRTLFFPQWFQITQPINKPKYATVQQQREGWRRLVATKYGCKQIGFTEERNTVNTFVSTQECIQWITVTAPECVNIAFCLFAGKLNWPPLRGTMFIPRSAAWLDFLLYVCVTIHSSCIVCGHIAVAFYLILLYMQFGCLVSLCIELQNLNNSRVQTWKAVI